MRKRRSGIKHLYVAVAGWSRGLAVLVLAGLLLYWPLPIGVRAAEGDLDPSFGDGGKVTTDFFSGPSFVDWDEASDVAVQPDGKIVAVGFANGGFNFTRDFALARYNPDGSLDSSFGTGGKVSTDFIGGEDFAFSLVLQPDSKIVVAGSIWSQGFGIQDVGLARYNPDGSLDSSFGTGGKVTTDLFGDSDNANTLLLQPDGKIIVVGSAIRSPSIGTGIDFALARYNTDGSLDLSFGSGGKVITDFFTSGDQSLGAALQSDGRIVAAGFIGVGLNDNDFALARYNTDGSLDTTFDSDGKVTTDFLSNFDEIHDIVIQGDGKIVAAGRAQDPFTLLNDFALARYNTNGSLDLSFGTGGKVLTDFFGNSEAANGLAIQPDGKIIAAGSIILPLSVVNFALARYDTTGTPDPTFSSDGRVITSFFDSRDIANAVAIQPDGRIIAAGIARAPDDRSDEFALARYVTDQTIIHPRSESFASNGGSDAVNVIAPTSFTWMAASNAAWIIINSGSSGTGNGTVQYSVTANTDTSPRSGTLTIAEQTFTVFQGAQFDDVPLGHLFYTEIGKLSARGVTVGCGSGNYCPDQPVLRDQMAAFIIRALGEFNPPQPPQQRFADVPPQNSFYAFVEQMAVRQITVGCGGENYCPSQPVLREQMAAFIIRALHPPGYVPSQPAMQRYADVPPDNGFYRFIEEMAVRGVTFGCGGGNYCPSQSVTRGQMAAFLVRAFNL